MLNSENIRKLGERVKGEREKERSLSLFPFPYSSKKSIDIPPKLTEVTTVAIVGGRDTVPLVQFSEKI